MYSQEGMYNYALMVEDSVYMIDLVQCPLPTLWHQISSHLSLSQNTCCQGYHKYLVPYKAKALDLGNLTNKTVLV